ncbi:MAG: 2-phospho-L-lactate guanylyltransferase [Nitrosopumilus sp.]|nr:2-phospho-L-lactate guanylyltransferase [Nitrosopumilus sp.]
MKVYKTAIIIPVKKFENSKTRLSSFLNVKERIKLTELLILDTLDRISKLKKCQIIIVSNERIKLKDKYNDIVIINENNNNGVNNAIELANKYIENNEFSESIIIPIDLPLLSTKELENIIEFSRTFEKGICIVPSRRFDGTNILLRKPNLVIETFYDNNSFYNHIKKTTEKQKIIKIFNYENLMIDLDTIEDVKTIIDIYNNIIINEKIKIKKSKSINFLKEIMINKLKN